MIEFYIAARTLPIIIATLTYPVIRLGWSVIQILSPTETTSQYYVHAFNKEII
jgi:hypothetical protein